ncbi:hypothetical protein Tco_0336569 [Tanacetum coccineum]
MGNQSYGDEHYGTHGDAYYVGPIIRSSGYKIGGSSGGVHGDDDEDDMSDHEAPAAQAGEEPPRLAKANEPPTGVLAARLAIFFSYKSANYGRINEPLSSKFDHFPPLTLEQRKALQGACQLLRGKLVCWSSKKQQFVAMSSAEAECVAAAGCCANILWMKTGGNFLDKMPQEGLAIIESKSKVRYSRSRANDSRVSTDAPLSNSSSSNNSFDMQQIAASLEDKMTIKMNKMLNEMKALVVSYYLARPTKQ